jgi:hypothetical protein
MQARREVESQQAGGATPPPNQQKKKILTLVQEQMVREFTDTYRIKRDQISFDGESLDPIFDYDALSLLALELSDIPKIKVENGDFNPSVGLATAVCTVTLIDGRERETFASAMVGEVLFDGTVIEDLGSALNMTRSRALRIGLRSVGFDPVVAHEQRKTAAAQPADFVDLRNSELAEIHMLGEELGYLLPEDEEKATWKNLIATYFRGQTSSGDLNDLQRSQFLGMLRAWKSARMRTNDSSMASVLLSNKQES